MPGFTTLQWTCTAHKIHAIAEKCWNISGDVLSGVCAVLLAVQTSQQLARLKEAMECIVRETFHWERHEVLSPSARKYRQSVLELFLPQRARQPAKRSRILSLAMVMNGDWRRRGIIVHRCEHDCCSCKDQALSKVLHVLSKALKSLRPGRLCRANWAEWARPLAFIGIFAHVHGLLIDAFVRAFKPQAAQTMWARFLATITKKLLKLAFSFAAPRHAQA
eukprot:4389865-Amphidinium_carterae.1